MTRIFPRRTARERSPAAGRMPHRPTAPTEQRSGTSQAPGTAQGWGRWRALTTGQTRQRAPTEELAEQMLRGDALRHQDSGAPGGAAMPEAGSQGTVGFVDRHIGPTSARSSRCSRPRLRLARRPGSGHGSGRDPAQGRPRPPGCAERGRRRSPTCATMAAANTPLRSIIGMGYYDTITPPRDPAQRPREPRLVHGVHAVPARDLPGPPRGAHQLPDDGRATSPAWRSRTPRCSTRRTAAAEADDAVPRREHGQRRQRSCSSTRTRTRRRSR